MRLSELLLKMGRGETLNSVELQELSLKADVIDQVDSLVSGWVVPGTTVPFIKNLQAQNIKIPSGEITLGDGTPGDGFSGVRIAFPALVYNGESWNLVGINNDVLQIGIRASDGKFIAAGGNVEISGAGIKISEGDVGQSWLTFLDVNNNEIFSIKVASGSMNFQTLLNGSKQSFFIKMTNGDTPYLDWSEDPNVNNKTYFGVSRGVQGALLDMGNVKLSGEGSSGGSSYVELTTTANPSITDANKTKIYMVGNKLVLQILDGATTRYKYLDLAGTGVTWIHTTTAPTP